MALKHPRADSLAVLRDLAHLVDKGLLVELASLYRYPESGGLSMRRGKWSRSRAYHYWSALRDLGIAAEEAGRVHLSGLGRRLVEAGKFGGMDPEAGLSAGEQGVLREALVGSPSVQTFLSFFCSSGVVPAGVEEFRREGGVVEVGREKGGRRMDLVLASGEIRSLEESEVRAFKWTLKNWCKACALVDEIVLWESHPRPTRYRDHVLYVVKNTLEGIELRQFEEMLSLVVSEEGYRCSYIYLPYLAYDFCLRYFTPMGAFHRLLVALHKRSPYEYYLEKGSTVYHCNTKIKKYYNFPMVDHVYRSYLVVSEREHGRRDG